MFEMLLGALVLLREPAAVVDELQVLELRVIDLRGDGAMLVDRGLRDGVAVGDAVSLTPKGAAALQARVVEVFERDALVELLLPGDVLALGTKGRVWVRKIAPVERVEGEVADEQPETVEPEVAAGPRWSRKDDGWDASEHLLARVRAEKPGDRPLAVHGHVYSAIGGTTNLDADRGHGYLRAGLDVMADNPFGYGGRLNIDGEYDLRNDFVPSVDGSDRSHQRLRVDELSYHYGGTRYAPEGHEVGRFWLGTTPELGRLDGYEWTRHLKSGSYLGASAGYLVENGFDGSTGHEMAFNAFYKWVPDRRERIAVTGAVQKTFYNGKRDRQLFFLKATAAPDSGLGPWALHSAFWYDVYSSEDDFEEGGAELSRAWVQAWRDYDSSVGGRRDDIALHYRHEGFVETLGVELPPLYAEGLVNEKSDRLGVDGDMWFTQDRKLFYAAGIWQDEEESGGDVEAGIWIGDEKTNRHGDLRMFASAGRSSTTLGLGAGFGRDFEGDGAATWDLSYELLMHDRYGFTPAVDDSTQHRLRYTVDFGQLGQLGLWRLAGHADMLVGADDVGLSTGFFLTRSF